MSSGNAQSGTHFSAHEDILFLSLSTVIPDALFSGPSEDKMSQE